MDPQANGGKQKDPPAKKSGNAAKRTVGQNDKQGAATQQEIRQDKIAQQSEPDRIRSVMNLSDDEGASSNIDTQAIPATAIAENTDERHQKISAAAYARAERRGFEPGKEEEDWLRAEAELYGGYTHDGDDQEGKRKQQRGQNESQ